MIKFVTVWILTVQYVDIHRSTPAYGASHSYQLQYATQKLCLEQAKQHQQTLVKKGTWGAPDQYIREGYRAQCNFAQMPVGVK